MSDQIKKPQIRRFALRAGIKAISADSIVRASDILQEAIEQIVRASAVIVTYNRRKTLMADDVRLSLLIGGEHIAIDESRHYEIPTGGRRKKLNSITSELAKHALLIDRSTFSRLCRNVDLDQRQDIRFSKSSIALIQIYCENMLGKLFSACALILTQEGRSTLARAHVESAWKLFAWNLTPKVSLSFDENRNKNRLTNGSFSDLLRAKKPDFSMSSEARALLHQLVASVSTRAFGIMKNLLVSSETKTLSSRGVKDAVLLLTQGELQKSTYSKGVRTVTKYNASLGYPPTPQARKAAGLTISIARVENMMRASNVAPRIASGAPLFFAGVLEKILEEVLGLAIAQATLQKRVTISSQHIQQAVAADEDLSKLFAGTLTSIAM